MAERNEITLCAEAHIRLSAGGRTGVGLALNNFPLGHSRASAERLKARQWELELNIPRKAAVKLI
jgi:hypothetical protein